MITAAQSGVAVFRIVKMHRGEWTDSATFKVVIGHLSPTCTPREFKDNATSSTKDENTAAAVKPQAAEAETAPRAIGKPPAGAAKTEKTPVRARKKLPPVLTDSAPSNAERQLPAHSTAHCAIQQHEPSK